jgi:large subunit ribosomal protein L15
MRLHDLKAPAGAFKSATGKTATRGHKGARARASKLKTGFEGGQMPLQRRLPKVGFKNPFRKEYACVNVCDLNRFEDDTEVTLSLLMEKGLVRKALDGLKILGKGELERKLVVVADKVSEGAREKIQARGGAVKEA